MSENPGQRPQQPGANAAADPFAAWKAMFQTGEATWTTMLEQMMGSQAFTQAMGQYLENSLKAQEVARKAVETNLSAMNLPTKSDLTRLASQIVALDAKLDDLSETVEQLADEVKALRARGPEGFGKRLDEIAASISALSGDAVSKPATTSRRAKTTAE
jgi:polyhydroxyalkanoic acid synthase PhaR subunit